MIFPIRLASADLLNLKCSCSSKTDSWKQVFPHESRRFLKDWIISWVSTVRGGQHSKQAWRDPLMHNAAVHNLVSTTPQPPSLSVISVFPGAASLSKQAHFPFQFCLLVKDFFFFVTVVFESWEISMKRTAIQFTHGGRAIRSWLEILSGLVPEGLWAKISNVESMPLVKDKAFWCDFLWFTEGTLDAHFLCLTTHRIFFPAPFSWDIKESPSKLSFS